MRSTSHLLCLFLLPALPFLERGLVFRGHLRSSILHVSACTLSGMSASEYRHLRRWIVLAHASQSIQQHQCHRSSILLPVRGCFWGPRPRRQLLFLGCSSGSSSASGWSCGSRRCSGASVPWYPCPRSISAFSGASSCCPHLRTFPSFERANSALWDSTGKLFFPVTVKEIFIFPLRCRFATPFVCAHLHHQDPLCSPTSVCHRASASCQLIPTPTSCSTASKAMFSPAKVSPGP